MLSPQPVDLVVRCSPVGIEIGAKTALDEAFALTLADGIERLIYRSRGPDRTTYWHERLGEIADLPRGTAVRCIGHVYRAEDAC